MCCIFYSVSCYTVICIVILCKKEGIINLKLKLKIKLRLKLISESKLLIKLMFSSKVKMFGLLN
jgi:hypothetical protein